MDRYGGAIITSYGVQIREIGIKPELLLLLKNYNINIVGVEIIKSQSLHIWSLYIYILYIPPNVNILTNILDNIFNFIKLRGSFIEDDFNGHQIS